MSQILKVFCIVWILAFSSVSYANKDAKDNALYLEIKRLLQKYGEKDLNAGIYIKNLTDGSVKFSYHPERFFAPASVVKIFTAYEALSYLGPDYKFRSSLLSNGSLQKNGVLKSDLHVRFSGNPHFTYEDLKEMLQNSGLKTIDGNIVIDGTMFDDQHSAPGGFTWDDNNFYYAAPSSAIIINKNVSEAKMCPSASTGKAAELSIFDPAILMIENNVTTVIPSKQECPYKSKYLGENKYEVYGCMFKDPQSEVKLKFALQDNNLMAQNYIQKALNELRIRLSGRIKFANSIPKAFQETDVILSGERPERTFEDARTRVRDEIKSGLLKGEGYRGNLKKIYTHYSPPLAQVLKEMLEESYNLSASSIFKHIAARYTSAQASDEKAESVMKDLLKKAGLTDHFIIRDGAGASQYNLVTPKAVVKLLEIAYKDIKSREAFIDALAIYGKEGTLKSRDLGKNLNAYTYGKTGSTKRASSIAGYYLPATGQKYAFAILINNYTIPLDKVKLLEDKILQSILNKTT